MVNLNICLAWVMAGTLRLKQRRILGKLLRPDKAPDRYLTGVSERLVSM